MKKQILFLTVAAFVCALNTSASAASQTDGEYMDWSYVRDMAAEPEKNTSEPTTTPEKIAAAQKNKNDQVYITEGIIPVPKTGANAPRDLDTGYEQAVQNYTASLPTTLENAGLNQKQNWNIHRLTEQSIKTSIPAPQPGTVQFQYPVQVKYPVQIKYPVQVQPQVTVQRPIMVTQPIVVQRPVVMTQPVTVQQPPMYYTNQPITMQQAPIYMTNQPMVVNQQAYASPVPMTNAMPTQSAAPIPQPIQSITQPPQSMMQPMMPLQSIPNLSPVPQHPTPMQPLAQQVSVMPQPMMMPAY